MPELVLPEAPEAYRYLLQLFREMAAGRQSGFAEPCAISWSEMLAWAQMTGIDLAPWEVRVLRMLDRAWLLTWRECQPKAKS